MKLFTDTHKMPKPVRKKGMKDGKEVVFISVAERKGTPALNPETVDYLLNGNGGKVLGQIRDLIVNLYNHNAYPDLDLFGLLRGADTEHCELMMDILEHCSLEYGDACFLLIDDLAPQIIQNFYQKER